jgi:hypothetical protein
MKIKKFSPLSFLAALGAGGIAVMPFVLMQYTIDHGEGLITQTQLWSNNFSGLDWVYYFSLEVVMIVFSLLHFVLTIHFSIKLFKWLKTEDAKDFINDPLRNAGILSPIISLLMTMNLFIGPIRYFLPALSNNFQDLFAPAFAFWLAIFVMTLWIEIKLLKISFEKSFDVQKIHFGWLLHPFLLGMLSTVGTGIAAMSKDASIAEAAAFFSMISFSMGVFLLLVKLITLFKSHFSAPGLPEKNFLPSFLIVIPNITLFAISAFRFGHFLEKQYGFHLDSYFYIVIGLSFAFEIWYMLFGLSLLWDYFKKHHFREFYITQWGLICPFVAFVVLGAFAYDVVISSPYIYGLLVLVMIATIAFYFELLYKHWKCSKFSPTLDC